MNATDEEPMFLTVPEAAHICRVSIKHMRRVLADGMIPSVKLGQRRLVPRRALEALADGALTGSYPTD